MHIQLAQALSAVTGPTGLRIIRAIVAGERAPHTLAALRNDRGKKEAEEMALALTGPWRAEPLFGLTPALALFDVSTVQISACDAQIAGAFSGIKPRVESPPMRPPCHSPPG